MSKLGHYLLAKPLRANLLALLFVLMPLPVPGAAIAAIMLGLITLQRGPSQGLVVLAWIAIPALAAVLKWQLIAAHYELSFAICAMTWFLAVAFRYWRSSWAKTAEMAAVLGLFYLLLLYSLPGSTLYYLQSHLEQATIESLRQVLSLDLASITQMVHDKAFFLLGAFYFALCLIAIGYLAMARIWQLSVVERRQQRIEFLGIQACRISGIVGALVIVAAMIWHWDVLEAAAFIVAIPFLLSGLSVLLYGCFKVNRLKSLRVILLMLLMMVLIILPAIAFAVMTLVGFCDIWLNCRRLQWLPSGSRLSSGHLLK